MIKKIYKFFWVWDFEKEENWLNEMAAKGFVLINVGFCKYEFKECIPSEYKIRLEFFKTGNAIAGNQNYINFLKETGAEYIGAFARWGYFRKKTSDGDFDLFSDIDSRINHLNRIMLFLCLMGSTNFLNSIKMIIQYLSRHNELNLSIFVLCCTLSVLILYGLTRLYIKKMNLKKERTLHE